MLKLGRCQENVLSTLVAGQFVDEVALVEALKTVFLRGAAPVLC
jgi:hypothetical protein